MLGIPLGTLLSLSVPCFPFLKELKQKLATDPKFITMCQSISENPVAYTEYTITQNLILQGGWIWIPKNSHFISTLLMEFHSSPIEVLDQQSQ